MRGLQGLQGLRPKRAGGSTRRPTERLVGVAEHPYDFNYAMYGVGYNTAATIANPTALWFSDDGSHVFYRSSGSSLRSRHLSTPWDVATAGSEVSASVSESNGAALTADGTRLFTVASSRVSQDNLSVPFDITTATESENQISVSNGTSQVYVSPDGSRLAILRSTSSSAIIMYEMTTPGDLSTAVQIGTLSDSMTTKLSMSFSDDGRKLHIAGQQSSLPVIRRYTLATPYDLTAGVAYDGQISMPTAVESTPCIYVRNDGQRFFICGADLDEVIPGAFL